MEEAGQGDVWVLLPGSKAGQGCVGAMAGLCGSMAGLCVSVAGLCGSMAELWEPWQGCGSMAGP